MNPHRQLECTRITVNVVSIITFLPVKCTTYCINRLLNNFLKNLPPNKAVSHKHCSRNGLCSCNVAREKKIDATVHHRVDQFLLISAVLTQIFQMTRILCVVYFDACISGCKYDKGTWSKCNANNEMTRTDVLRNPNESDVLCEKTKLITKTCRSKTDRNSKGRLLL